MHAVGLAARARVGRRRVVVVEQEAVVGLGAGARPSARHQPPSSRVMSWTAPSTSSRTCSGGRPDANRRPRPWVLQIAARSHGLIRALTTCERDGRCVWLSRGQQGDREAGEQVVERDPGRRRRRPLAGQQVAPGPVRQLRARCRPSRRRRGRPAAGSRSRRLIAPPRSNATTWSAAAPVDRHRLVAGEQLGAVAPRAAAPARRRAASPRPDPSSSRQRAAVELRRAAGDGRRSRPGGGCPGRPARSPTARCPGRRRARRASSAAGALARGRSTSRRRDPGDAARRSPRASAASSNAASTSACSRRLELLVRRRSTWSTSRPRAPPSRRRRAGARARAARRRRRACQSRFASGRSPSGMPGQQRADAARAHSSGSSASTVIRARTSSLRLVSWVDSVVIAAAGRADAGAAARRGTPRPRCRTRRVAADLGERDEPGVAVEGGVLDALGHHRPGGLLEAGRGLGAGLAPAPGAAASSAGARSGRRLADGGDRGVEVLARRRAGRCGRPGSRRAARRSASVCCAGSMPGSSPITRTSRGDLRAEDAVGDRALASWTSSASPTSPPAARSSSASSAASPAGSTSTRSTSPSAS